MSNNLPINVDTDRSMSNISYANEVIAIIAGMAASEVEGIASMTNQSAIADLFGRGKSITRGVKVEVGVEEASAELMLVVEYGKPISKVCTEVQESVKKAIETMTGLHVVRVDVHVTGVSFERETQEIERGYFKAIQKSDLLEPSAEPAAQAKEGDDKTSDEALDAFFDSMDVSLMEEAEDEYGSEPGFETEAQDPAPGDEGLEE